MDDILGWCGSGAFEPNDDGTLRFGEFVEDGH